MDYIFLKPRRRLIQIWSFRAQSIAAPTHQVWRWFIIRKGVDRQTAQHTHRRMLRIDRYRLFDKYGISSPSDKFETVKKVYPTVWVWNIYNRYLCHITRKKGFLDALNVNVYVDNEYYTVIPTGKITDKMVHYLSWWDHVNWIVGKFRWPN